MKNRNDLLQDKVFENAAHLHVGVASQMFPEEFDASVEFDHGEAEYSLEIKRNEIGAPWRIVNVLEK